MLSTFLISLREVNNTMNLSRNQFILIRIPLEINKGIEYNLLIQVFKHNFTLKFEKNSYMNKEIFHRFLYNLTLIVIITFNFLKRNKNFPV